MLYRRFGRTEIRMPVFSCGGMRYQHHWKDCPLDQVPAENQENLENTIRRSVELGINHIETARGYGSSERQLGVILPRFPRDEIVVQTKVAPEENPQTFEDNVRESLERLRLDHVDLFAIHGINNEELLDMAVRPGGCLERARKLKAEGLLRHIGFSTHAIPELLPKIVGYDDGEGGFDYVNLHWYWIYQKNLPSIEIAARRDMGLFIISPSDKGGMLYKPPDRLVELTKPLHPIVFNDLFCLMNDDVHTLSLGAARPGDFDLHVEAVEKWWDRRGELVPEICARLDDAMAREFGDGYWRAFDEGVPDYRHVPGNVNAQIVLWLHALVRAFGMKEYGEMRYNLLGNAGHWFPGANVSHLDEPAFASAIAGAPHADRIVPHLREAHEMLFKEPVKRLSESDS